MASHKPKKKAYYAVRAPPFVRGIYLDWPSCEAAVIGVKGARYKKFSSREEADEFLGPGPLSVDQDRGPSHSSGSSSHDHRGGNSDHYHNHKQPGGSKKRTRDYDQEEEVDDDEEEEEEEEEEEDKRWSSRSTMSKVPRMSDEEATVSMYYDGASRGNPGLAGCGAVIYSNKGMVKIWSDYNFLGRNSTNNVAEYSGLCLGLEAALKRGVRHIRVYGDSELVTRQLRGEYKVKAPGLVEHYERACAMREQFDSFVIESVPRAQNAVADALANEAINRYAFARPPGTGRMAGK